MARNPSGENRVVEAERDALARAGHEVELIAVHTDDLEDRPGYGLRAAVRVATGLGRSPVAELERFRPDVVHVHNLFPNLGRRWVDDVEVPVVHTLHNYRPMCAAATLFRDGAVCTCCPDGDRWAGFRYACYRDSRAATLPLTIAGLGGAGADPLLRRADRIVTLSEQMRRRYVDDGVDPARIVVWPNFLPDELDPGPLADGPGGPAGGPWMFVGRLTAEKGALELVEHWPDGHRLDIIGDGPLRDQVREAARGRPIVLLGRLPRREVLDRMRSSVGLVFPSRSYEAFGLAYMEALAAGLPVMASGPHVVADMVERDGTGAVTRLEGLGSALEVAGGRFRELRHHCRAVFEARYTAASHVTRATALYEELVADA